MGRAVSHEQPQLQRADDAQLFCRVLVATAQNEALCVCVCVCVCVLVYTESGEFIKKECYLDSHSG